MAIDGAGHAVAGGHGGVSVTGVATAGAAPVVSSAICAGRHETEVDIAALRHLATCFPTVMTGIAIAVAERVDMDVMFAPFA